MKFTTLTRAIGSLNLHPAFKHTMNLACLTGTPLDSVAVIADRFSEKAGHIVVTDKIWEHARDTRRKAKYRNAQTHEARKDVRAIFESVAGALGSNLSAIKHALETRHSVKVMRPFVLSVTDMTREGIEALKAAYVPVTMIKGKPHKLMPVEIPFDELETCLYEQVRQFYIKRETG